MIDTRIRCLPCKIAALCLLCLAGCSTGPSQPEEGKETASATQPATPPSSEQDVGTGEIEGEDFVPGLALRRDAWTGDLDGMLERRHIRVLVVPSRTMYFYDRGKPQGATLEAFREFERYLNETLKRGNLLVHVVFVPVARDQLLPALLQGKGDIAAANLTITPERGKQVDFSDPLLSDVSEIVITGPGAPALATVNDLAGREVHVRRSSSYYESLQRLNGRFRAAGQPEVVVRPADEVLEDEDLLEMVNAGLIGITVTDSHKARFWKQVFDGIEIHPDVAISEGGAIGWALRKESPKLKELLNGFVEGHRAGTSFGNTILNRYLKNTKWVKNSASEQEMQKFQAVVALFQKYAAQYEFDWLMVAAQAYQESGLDNNARSQVGAVGIMQVMPETAKGSPINIANPEDLESNIHAGVKVLREYTNKYFNEPGVDQLNRTLFAFAGYNAGPNRINRLRERAAKQGLNPDVWFKNVELVAAKSIGRETVQYVANVYKYYLTYKLVTEQDEAREEQRAKARSGVSR
jgi:membrane-bound lytic murein transglycosylase MltF